MARASNQRVRRTILLLTIGVTPCFILVGRTAPAAEQIDQSNLPEWAGGWTHVNPTGEGQAAMWQTFRPGRPNLTAVEIDILTITPGHGDDVLTVEIAKDGDVLASAECSVADGFDGLLRFEFQEAVPLVPEQIYELTVRDTGKTRFGWKYSPNTYERGSRYVLAQERPGTDWFFQTYSGVEPAEARYSGGTGEPNDPYQIATVEDLMLLGESPEDYGKHFILTADIDLDPNLPGRKVFDKAVIDSLRGFFDGAGHTISRLTVNGGMYAGLFGELRIGAKVQHLGIVDVNVIASDDYAGGLVGINGGAVTGCYTTGAVRGRTDVGGLVGDNWGTVAQCYSTCAVNGGNGIGGLMGANSAGIVFNCYSSGPVRGTDRKGGLIAYNHADVIQCFWDIQTSDQTTSAAGTGKTTAEMQMAKTFLDAGWDFVGETTNGTEDIWKIAEDLDYPRLAWEKYSGGRGVPDDPYQIATAEDLMRLGESPEDYDKHFILIADIDLDPNLSGRKVFDKAIIAPDTNLLKNYFQGTSFNGIFDGSGHIILNLTITGQAFLGLFGQLESGAQISNLGLEAVDVRGTGFGVGGLVGDNAGSIATSYCTGEVTGTSWVGGLVGNNLGNIDTSYNTGNITGNDNVGGLAGGNWGNIINSYSTGTVDGIFNVGGLVGENRWTGIIIGSYSTSTVTGNSQVGGLVGFNWNSIATSYTTGTIIGDELVGGLVGWNGGSIDYSCSTSIVSGEESVGGLVGLNSSGDLDGGINNSYSGGTVKGREGVGGLVGRNDGSITTSYTIGIVTGNEFVGGLVGRNSGDIITSFWDIQTVGQIASAGGTGKTTAEMQMAGTFLEAGWDFVDETANGTEDIWWINEGKDYPRLWWELIPEN